MCIWWPIEHIVATWFLASLRCRQTLLILRDMRLSNPSAPPPSQLENDDLPALMVPVCLDPSRNGVAQRVTVHPSTRRYRVGTSLRPGAAIFEGASKPIFGKPRDQSSSRNAQQLGRASLVAAAALHRFRNPPPFEVASSPPRVLV
jgi:hypothetical protein